MATNVKITLTNGKELSIPADAFRRILSAAESNLSMLQRHEGRLPIGDRRAQEAINTIRVSDLRMI